MLTQIQILMELVDALANRVQKGHWYRQQRGSLMAYHVYLGDTEIPIPPEK